MPLEIEVIDNSAAFLAELEAKIPVALEATGLQVESRTKNNIKGAGRVDTGYYRNSITHTVQDDTVYVGSNLLYALFNELGTGKYASDGKGRKGWWVYVKGSYNVPLADSKKTVKEYSFAEAKRIMALLRSKGLDAHMTEGLRPTHALQNAITQTANEWQKLLEAVLRT